LLTCNGVAVAGRLEPVTLDLSGGEHVLLTGPNGAGKSTLVDVIEGTAEPTSGSVHVHDEVRVGVLTQHEPVWQHPDLAAAEVYARYAARFDGAPGLASLGLLDRAARSTPAGRLSQGQQRRLHLSMVLSERPDLLILDEPTNHLSAVLVDAVTAAVKGTEAGVIVVTHDRQMLRDLGEWTRVELG
jgi:macrolide transport system ATP-binding/permease protein